MARSLPELAVVRRASRVGLAVLLLSSLGASAGCGPLPLLAALVAAGSAGALGGGGSRHSSQSTGGGGGGGGVGVEPEPYPVPVPAPSPFQGQPQPQPTPGGGGGQPAPSPSPTPFVPATIAVVSQPTDVTTVGVISPTIQITLQDAQGHVPDPSAGFSLTIALGANPGHATLHGTTTVLVGATGSPIGVATFGDLGVGSPGTGYTLVASLVGSSTVRSVTTAPFDVTTASPVWQAAGSVGTSAESAALGSDGRIYFTDGSGHVEAFDPLTGALQSNLPPPPSGGRSFARLAPDSNGLLYLMGGLDSGGPLATVEVYDPGKGTWATLRPLPTPRAQFGAALGADGRIYALGGAGSSQTIPLGAVEAFDPATGQWATLAPLPTPRRWLAATATPDGHVYAVGGFDAGGGASPTAEAYSIGTQSWSSLPDLGIRRIGLGVVAGLDGSVYAVGGDSAAGDWTILATVERLPSAGASWSRIPNMLHARAALGAVRGPDGRLYAVGGFDPFGNDVAPVEAFGPALALSVSSGAAGDSVVLTGSNFGPSATVSVSWANASGATPSATGATDATGTIAPAITAVVPSVPTGAYTVTVVDSVSQFVVTAPFTVGP